MTVMAVQLIGLTAFILGTVVLGLVLRRSPSADHARSLSRISHLLFWFGLVAPWTLGVFYPGGPALDEVLGVPSLALPTAARLGVGLVLVFAGVVFMQLSIAALKRRGSGAPALKLTSRVVDSGVYQATRNPMAFGFYLGLLGGALLSGSSYVLVYSLAAIAAHAFNLLFFEETELRERYGGDYERYRSSTPFLVPRLRATR